MSSAPFFLDLDGSWILAGRRESADARSGFFSAGDAEFAIPAEVPGNIELALSDAGLVPDPYFGQNSRKLRPFEFYEWMYFRDFEYDGGGRDVVFRFEGIDVLAEIFLNGRKLGACGNAFLPHEFSAGDALRPGENQLAVHLKSVPLSMDGFPFSAASAAGGCCFNRENLRIRRPAHEAGWDIAPRMALGGLFRGVALREKPLRRLKEGFLETVFLRGDSARCRFSYDFSPLPELGDDELTLTLDGVCGEATFHAGRVLWSLCGNLVFDVASPRLWWPKHYGQSDLYEVTVRLSLRGEILVEHRIMFGIRVVELRRSETVTAGGAPDFQFIVNQVPVRLWGTNHVPADALHSRDAKAYPELFAMLRELDVNALRVWGGNLYEQKEFYDFCDREGILVWQDFMMACAVYPNDEAFLAEIAPEAEAVVKMLRQHPSIALWCGDNECDMSFTGSHFPFGPEKNRITRETLPAICRLHDPRRPYLASSPLVSESMIRQAGECRDADALFALGPEQHLWGPRGYFKAAFYRDTAASFLSEIGYHGCPAPESIREFIPKESLFPGENADWYCHATNANYPHDLSNNYRIGLMRKQIGAFFDTVPDTLEEFALASQIVQAEALKFFLECARSRGKVSGLLWWNLRDCWPQFSDAVVDWYGRRKLAFAWLARVHHAQLLLAVEEGRRIAFVAVNDSRQSVDGHARATDAKTGGVLFDEPFRLAPGELRTLGRIDAPDEPTLLLLDSEWSNCGRRFNHFVTGSPLFSFREFRDEYLPLILDGDRSPSVVRRQAECCEV